MPEQLTAHLSVTIHATPEKVWQALTDPAMIKQYLFGTDTQTDWKKGSPIIYTGEWQGKKYTDKGTIIDIVPQQLLHTTYLSGMSKKEDKPENYANVIYELEPEGNYTTLHLSQDHIANDEEMKHMQQNWTMVLEGMKKLLEQ